jgi:hypothetical protein
LLHEYGHHLSGRRLPEDQVLERESLAWKHADELVQQYPDLLPMIGAYEKCKQRDYNSYLQYFANEINKPPNKCHE